MNSKHVSFLLTGCLLTGISLAHADEWSIGAGVGVEKFSYRDYDTKTYPLPIINYESQYFFFHGASLGAYLLNNETHRLSANIYYSPLRFTPSDTGDQALKQLGKRHSTAMVGVGYSYSANWGIVSTEIAADMLDNSNGVIADIAYQYKFDFNDFSITPKIGAQWQSADHNQYYYGINHKDAERSGLKQYSPNNSVTPYLSLYAQYSFNKNWQTFLAGRYNILTSEVKDSPMVDQSYNALFGAGIIYKF